MSPYNHFAGFGRAYRDLLYGHCGEMDIDDCAAAARHLVSSGRVDAARLCIVGQSAGGYAVLCAVLRPNLFSVGEQQLCSNAALCSRLSLWHQRVGVVDE